jgi:phenylalanyl-tRNA synthetase beta chain
MNISYNWLKEYVDFDLTPDEVAAALTSIGLETGSVEEVQTVKGGLEVTNPLPAHRIFVT